jgi:hypothetical protein
MNPDLLAKAQEKIDEIAIQLHETVESGTGSQEGVLQTLSLVHHALEAIVAALSSASRA